MTTRKPGVPGGELAGDSPYLAALDALKNYGQVVREQEQETGKLEAQLTLHGFDRDPDLMQHVQALLETAGMLHSLILKAQQRLAGQHAVGNEYHSSGRDADASAFRDRRPASAGPHGGSTNMGSGEVRGGPGDQPIGMHAELRQLLESVLPRAAAGHERAGRFDGQSGLQAPRPRPADWDDDRWQAYLAAYHQGRAGWLGCRDSRAADDPFGPPLHLDDAALAAAVGQGSDAGEATGIYLRAYAHFSGYRSTAEMLASHRLRAEIREIDPSGRAELRYTTPDPGGDQVLAGDSLRSALAEARMHSAFSPSEWVVVRHDDRTEISRYCGGRRVDSPAQS